MHSSLFDTSVSDQDLKSTFIDEFGVTYSKDRKRLLKSCPLQTYSIPEGTEIICDRAFQSTKIQSLILPNSLKAIGACAFANNEDITEIELPSSIQYLAKNNPFGGCKSLKKIHLHSQYFVLEEGVLYSSDYKVLYSSLFNFEPNVNLLINEQTEELAANCFWGQTNLGSIVIPPSVLVIGKAAFANSRIRYIDIQGSIKKLPTNFMNNAHCEHFEIPSSVEIIEEGAFSGSCFKMLVISSNIKRVGNSAFMYVKGLTSIKLENIESIGNRAFYYCHNLKHVSLNGSITKIEDETFIGCESLETIKLPPSVERLGNGSICMNPSLRSVYIPGELKDVDTTNFLHCSKLQEIRVEPQNYFQSYFILCKCNPRLRNTIIDTKYTIQGHNELCESAEFFYSAYNQSFTLDKEERFLFFKDSLINYSKKLRAYGWYRKTDIRNYIHTGYAAFFHAIHLKKNKEQDIRDNYICSLNEFGLAYSQYDTITERAEASIIMMYILIKSLPYLSSLIENCLVELNIELNLDNQKTFIAFITEYLFYRSVKIDEKAQKYIPLFEQRLFFNTESFYRIRYNFVTDRIKAHPTLFEQKDNEKIFERNYSLLMNKVRNYASNLSKRDYDDITSLDTFIKKVYIDKNNYYLI